MKDQENAHKKSETALTFKGSGPFPFTVIFSEAQGEKSGCSFEVTGKDLGSGLSKTGMYYLADRGHQSYLNFFEELAQDFGIRFPQNRQPTVNPRPTFKAAYREVLLDNLAPGMLYGYGDPALIRVAEGPFRNDPWYYLLATSNDAPDSFPILRSRNLEDWEFVDYVFPKGHKPVWAADGESVSDYWAPEMHQVGGEFKVYFVARDRDTRELCIGMAKSYRPEGPFLPDTEPILKGNVIDPHVFVEDTGTAFLYWKEDNNDVWPSLLIDLLYDHPDFIPVLFLEKKDQIAASFTQTLWPWARKLEPMERFMVQQILIEAVTSMFSTFHNRLEGMLKEQPESIQQKICAVLQFMKTPMYAQPLSEDGSRLVGKKKKVLENDLAWEAHLVEGMWVTKQGGKFYLFYAGNDFSTDQYGIGVAIADSPVGPYRKMPNPFLQSTEKWWAPGHPSLVTGPDGKHHLFLHAYFPGKAGYKQFRALLALPVLFEKDKVFLA